MHIFAGFIMAMLFFAIQLILCLKVKPLAARLIPAVVCASVFLYTLIGILTNTTLYAGDPSLVNPTPYSLGEFLMGFLIFAAMDLTAPLIVCLGDGAAWVVAKAIKSRKVS